MPALLQRPRSAVRPPRSDLHERYSTLHTDMVEQLDRAVAVENHWLIYTLLGWENLITCLISYYFVAIADIQYPDRWMYAGLWLVQTVVAFSTIRLIRGRPRFEESPLKRVVNFTWLIFIALCINLASLNTLAGLPVFVFLPALATLSSFAFAVLSALLSRKLLLASLAMFLTGMLMAAFPDLGFLIYGVGWLVVLQSLGVVFLLRRRQWLHAMRDFGAGNEAAIMRRPA